MITSVPHILALAVALSSAGACLATGSKMPVTPPTAFGTLPSDRQIKHADLETYAFLHFTVNTFTDREWGHGDESESLFNPTHFDPDQIALALKSAGMKGAILTAKHHDGFCLWPTKTTEHNISKTSWMGGHGDVVKAMEEACKRHGLKFGVYLSPWDRNSAHYGKPEYVQMYRQQLRELLTAYGPIFEVWHDGANGGSGYYGGANEDRAIDRRTYYDWPTTWKMVRELQPEACVFSDIGPDLRWVGNEEGFADATSWSTFDAVGVKGDQAAPGYVKEGLAPSGTPHGNHWIPAECDVSIRPGWFWHEAENAKVKTPSQLFELYCKSVGRGASFLLNVPPDRRGQIADPDVASLKEFGKLMAKTFRTNLASGSKLSASNFRGNSEVYGPKNILSSVSSRYWATDDSVTEPTIELDLKSEKTFDLVRLKEPIQMGQRVESFAVDSWMNGVWKEVGHATTIGSCRIIRMESPVTTKRIRFRVTHSPACVLLYGLGLFKEAPGTR